MAHNFRTDRNHLEAIIHTVPLIAHIRVSHGLND